MFTSTRTTRVEWGDCDPAGIIFYVRYFEFFDVSTAVLLFTRTDSGGTDHVVQAPKESQNSLALVVPIYRIRSAKEPCVETWLRWEVRAELSDD